MDRNRRGFTLVEVMIVVGIVAVIAAIAIPNLLRARVEANESVAQATLRAIANALENYASINNEYPTTSSEILGVTPPYLNVDYFTGIHHGYSYSANLSQYTYFVVATPAASSQGNRSFTIDTSGVVLPN